MDKIGVKQKLSPWFESTAIWVHYDSEWGGFLWFSETKLYRWESDTTRELFVQCPEVMKDFKITENGAGYWYVVEGGKGYDYIKLKYYAHRSTYKIRVT